MENSAEKKKVILCAIYPQGGEEAEDVSLGELERLAETAGCETAAIVTQCRERPDVKTVLGSGKIAELAGLCDALGVDLVVFDCELSP
ncbi:MAG: GTPase HflX, partial [Clostridia bacterium]|nr:GTPase HflX [Clostridia bacterium]